MSANVFTLRTPSKPILNRNSQGTMDSSGRYTLSYTPSNDPAEYLQTSVQMGISSDATLPDMLNFFTDFLRAAGYVFEGELEVVASDETLDNNYWKEKYLELMQVAGGEEVEDLVKDRNFWQEQTYKLLRPEE